ncbi:hypothetical protein ACH5RR_016059 [Cinchona calisaya]|uniref:malate dehydrogenase n=1 Tax=Cinchona calisaya TaxID=153742 RepID=A0ABD2ZXZ7_9GENT
MRSILLRNSIGLDWNILLKLWEFRSPPKILFEAYLWANFEEAVMKMVEVKKGRSMGRAVNTLEDKGNLRVEICHQCSSEVHCQMEEVTVDIGSDEIENFLSDGFEGSHVFDKMHHTNYDICEDGNEEGEERHEKDDENIDWNQQFEGLYVEEKCCSYLMENLESTIMSEKRRNCENMENLQVEIKVDAANTNTTFDPGGFIIEKVKLGLSNEESSKQLSTGLMIHGEECNFRSWNEPIQLSWILGPEELFKSCLVSSKLETCVKLRGRKDAIMDYFNLETSMYVKAWCCRELYRFGLLFEEPTYLWLCNSFFFEPRGRSHCYLTPDQPYGPKISIVGIYIKEKVNIEYQAYSTIKPKLSWDEFYKGLCKKTRGVNSQGINEEFQVQVAGFVGEEQLGQAPEGANVVIIPVGAPRKPSMTRDDLININAGIVKSLCTAITKYYPHVLVNVISNPMSLIVPISF